MREQLDDTLESHYRVLYERQRLRGKSLSQRRNHEIQLRHFARFLGRPAVLSDLTDATVGDVMQWLVDRGRAPRTANKFRDCICALWSFLKRKNIDGIDEWPDVQPFPVPERVPQCWSRRQLAALFDVLVNQTGFIGGIPAATWWVAFLSVMYDSGERLKAIVVLQWGDIDFDSGRVRFRAETRKGKTRDLIRELHPDTLATLASMRCDDCAAPVFPRKFCLGTLYNRYERILIKAKLPHDRASKFHRIRKTTASFFEAAGGNATDLLDHSSRRVTMRYLDPNVTGGLSTVAMLPRPQKPDDGPRAA